MAFVTKRDIPKAPQRCTLTPTCIYKDRHGICDEPQINRGNGDAACHDTAPRVLLAQLSPAA